MLGLIRTARWFVGTSAEFGPTLYFVSQFDRLSKPQIPKKNHSTSATN